MLLEGPSDEIIVSSLGAKIDLSLARAGAQAVPVIGTGEMPVTSRLFRMMGKRVVVLADLDALADGNQLVSTFAVDPRTQARVAQAGHRDVMAMDQQLRGDFAEAVSHHWIELEPMAAEHRYLGAVEAEIADDQARRRGALAVLLSEERGKLKCIPHNDIWTTLRDRFDALLNALEAGGCFILRRGTIEDYYSDKGSSFSAGKPEAAAFEAASFAERDLAELCRSYDDVIRALRCAAPKPPVNENALLRKLLAALLGAVLQDLKADTSQEDLYAASLAANRDAAQIFKIENASNPGDETPVLRISITSPYFRDPRSPH